MLIEVRGISTSLGAPPIKRSRSVSFALRLFYGLVRALPLTFLANIYVFVIRIVKANECIESAGIFIPLSKAVI